MLDGINNDLYKKHILVVSQYFYPESFRINDICIEWVKRGYEVTVVTGIPNYPEGKIYSGYGLNKRRKEVWNGINIIRIPLIPRGKTKFGLALNYLSFMITGFLAGKIMNIDADYIFSFETSPMTQVVTGVSFAKKLNIPHYLYVQDLWPDNVQAITGISSSLIMKPLDKIVNYIYNNSDVILTTSNSFAETISNRVSKEHKEKVYYWPQYAEEFYKPSNNTDCKLIPKNDNFKIVFTGNIGVAQGLDILPRTANILKEEKVEFVIVGDGRYKNKLIDEIAHYNVKDKFVLIPRQDSKDIPDLLGACDVAFISFENNDLWKKTIPAKLQSYMACGMPILAAAEGETKKIIEQSKCGLATPLGDEKLLSEAIKFLMNRDLSVMSSNSIQYFSNNFEKNLVMDKIDILFKNK